ncbi:MAG: nicotinamide mononucleotide transporter [Bacteroidales bacterium]|nr:nicotinamide mononucleotide transporter [Bacteroidales bacterium]
MEFLQFSDFWDWVELIAAILGILYVIYQIRQKVAMWYLDIFCAALYVAIGIHQHLWGSMVLNVYYVVISFLGIYRLTRDKARLAADPEAEKDHDIVVRRMSRRTALVSGLVFLVSASALFFILRKLDDPQPNLDAVTMTLSFIGTYWLTNSHIEQWLLWVVSDTMQVVMFASLGMIAPAIMFVVYLSASIYGYFHWRKHMTVIE